MLNTGATMSSTASPFVAEYLSSSLKQFIGLSAVRGQKWSKSKIAEEITYDEGIPGKVSDTTIGRLLDPASKQEPTEETLAAVAAFLIRKGAITPKQLDLVKRQPSLIDAVAFSGIFLSGSPQKHKEFLKDLVGRYSAVEARASYVLSSELILKPLPGAECLVVQEVMTLFYADNIDLLKRETRNFSAEMAGAVWTKMRAAGGRDIESYTSAGFVVATADMIAFFLRSSARGFPSLLNVSQVRFADGERILGMEARRNSGWRAAAARPLRSEGNTSPRERIRTMAEELIYTKIMLDKSRDDLQSAENTRTRGQDFFRIDHRDETRNGGNIERLSGSTERLLESIANNDLDAFRQALAEQADPNVHHPNSLEPILFSLASDGRLEWVEALIATGRCDVTSMGLSGFRASYAPGVTARFFAATGPVEIVQKFAKIAETLHAEEGRQKAGFKLSPPRP